MPDTLIDLNARARWAAVLVPVGFVAWTLLGVALLVDLVVGTGPLPTRLVGGAAGLLVVTILLTYRLGRDRRARWLAVDHNGLRLVNARGGDILRFRWDELAGVGLMTDEAARRRKLFAASLRRPLTVLIRRLVFVSVWLELYPASPAAVERRPELKAAWVLGAPRRPGQDQRWLLRLSGGIGQHLPAVAEHVERWRPGLWRGHRAGSVLFG